MVDQVAIAPFTDPIQEVLRRLGARTKSMYGRLADIFSAKARKFFAKTRKFSAKARKFLITANKITAKFDAFRLRTSLLQLGLDVNQSLQVKPHSMFDCAAFGPDLHDHEHVKVFDLLPGFCF